MSSGYELVPPTDSENPADQQKDMGVEEQLTKSEARDGDQTAQLVALPTSQPRTKAAGLQRHQFAIFLIGVPAITFGTLSVMYNKWLRDADHFKTWHGTFGLLCMLWIIAQVGIGGGSVWFDGAAFGGGVKAKALWKYHRLSGYILFPMLLFTVNLGGAWSNWGQKYTSAPVRVLAFVIAPAALLTAVYSRVRTSKMKF
ncbi:hypothetical protein VNI00_005813 [Paramarasmius palmivorus]|uniref:Cytochrome b561 domain-containing protein n=1 Tax=Paramarasmius palmivorus TaxID=297713 RepID=A0AAW0DAS7_9AGAR